MFRFTIKYSLIFYLASLFIACNGSSSNNDNHRLTYSTDYKNKVGLQKVDSIFVPLDTLTSNNITNLQYYTDTKTGNNYICILNQYDNSIYFYNYNNLTNFFKIRLQKEGPNGIGPNIEKFYIKSIDSIFITCRYRISIVDSSGIVKRRYDMSKKQSNRFTALPFFSHYNEPAFQQGRYFFLACAPDLSAFKMKDFSHEQCILKLDKETGSYTYKLTPSDLYREGIYGPNYSVPYNCFDHKTNLIYSFPNDPLIYRYNTVTDDVDTFYAGSKDFDKVAPMTKVTEDFEGYTKFYIRNPSYGPIIFDQYRNVYYRFALTPLSEADYAARKWWKNKSLIILDSSLNKIGETDISDYNSFLTYFVTADGLFIGTVGKEDQLTLEKFSLKNL